MKNRREPLSGLKTVLAPISVGIESMELIGLPGDSFG
jgi:hypothetical protein